MHQHIFHTQHKITQLIDKVREENRGRENHLLLWLAIADYLSLRVIKMFLRLSSSVFTLLFLALALHQSYIYAAQD